MSNDSSKPQRQEILAVLKPALKETDLIVSALGPRRTTEVTGRLVERVRPVMTPYQPVVVFLSALAPE